MSHLFSCPLNWSFLFHVWFWLSTLQLFLFKSEVTCMELNLSEQPWKREDLIQGAQKSSLVVLSVPQTTECFVLEVNFILAELEVPDWVPGRLNWPCAGHCVCWSSEPLEVPGPQWISAGLYTTGIDYSTAGGQMTFRGTNLWVCSMAQLIPSWIWDQ